MKRWLLREEPEEKHDIRLWQTFRNIDMQTTMKAFEENPAVKAATTPHLMPGDRLIGDHDTAHTPSQRSSSASVACVSSDAQHSTLLKNQCCVCVSIRRLPKNDRVTLVLQSKGNSMASSPATSPVTMRDTLRSSMRETQRRVPIRWIVFTIQARLLLSFRTISMPEIRTK
jgi:hypothetical protein